LSGKTELSLKITKAEVDHVVISGMMGLAVMQMDLKMVMDE